MEGAGQTIGCPWDPQTDNSASAADYLMAFALAGSSHQASITTP